MYGGTQYKLQELVLSYHMYPRDQTQVLMASVFTTESSFWLQIVFLKLKKKFKNSKLIKTDQMWCIYTKYYLLKIQILQQEKWRT